LEELDAVKNNFTRHRIYGTILARITQKIPVKKKKTFFCWLVLLAIKQSR